MYVDRKTKTTGIIYLSEGNEIKVLQPQSAIEDNLVVLATIKTNGNVTAMAYDYSEGELLIMTDTVDTHVTGFTIDVFDETYIPFTESTMIYNQYQDHLAPSTSNDYLMLPAEQVMQPAILDYTFDQIINRYMFTAQYAGFIFEDGKLKEVLKQRVAQPLVMGELRTLPSNQTFFEMRPILTKYFGWREDTTSCIPETACMLDGVANPRALCENITRCEGYVGGCLIEARSWKICTFDSSKRYYKKQFRHRIFETIEENWYAYIGGFIGFGVVHLYFIFMLSKFNVQLRRRIKSEKAQTETNFHILNFLDYDSDSSDEG